MSLGRRHDPGGKDAAAVRVVRAQGLAAGVLVHQLQHARRRIVVIHHVPLGRGEDQILEDRHELRRSATGHLPLRRGGQRNPQRLLQIRQTVSGHPIPIAQQGHHADRRGVVLLLAGVLGLLGSEYRAAKVAAKSLEFVHLPTHRRLAHQPYQSCGLGLLVHFAAVTVGTGIAGAQPGVGHHHRRATGILFRTVSAVPRACAAAGSLLWPALLAARGSVLIGGARRGLLATRSLLQPLHVAEAGRRRRLLRLPGSN